MSETSGMVLDNLEVTAPKEGIMLEAFGLSGWGVAAIVILLLVAVIATVRVLSNSPEHTKQAGAALDKGEAAAKGFISRLWAKVKG